MEFKDEGCKKISTISAMSNLQFDNEENSSNHILYTNAFSPIYDKEIPFSHLSLPHKDNITSYQNYTWADEIITHKEVNTCPPKKNGVSLIIPTKNEAKNIPHVFPHIPKVVDEIIIVDSSTDNTIDEIKKYTPDAKIIKTEPKGKGNALKIGFQNATHDIIVMMDADGSMNPSEIPDYAEPLKNGMDVVQGSRILGGSEDLTHIRRFGNFFFVSLVNFLYGSNYTDMCYGYRSFRKEVIDNIDFDSDGFDVETEMSIRACKKGFKICEIPSYETNRIYGVSNLCAIRDGFKILSRIIAERSNDS